MVKLWCLKNGLEHFEASAATGEGIDVAFRELMRLAMASKEEERTQREQQQQQQFQQGQNPNQYWRSNKELDLHQRYAPKEERCLERYCLPLMRPLLRYLR